MAMPYALLRAGFPYVKTLGMRRVTDAPVGVAVGSDDKVYVLCRLPGSSPIRKLTWDDDFLGPVGASEASFEWPVAIAMDAEDNIYVSDEATHRITAITTDGEFLGSWGERGDGQGELNGPSGIAFDLDGSIYVSDTLNHRVQRFTKDGVFLSTWGSFGDGDGQFNMPWGVAVDPIGDVYVVDWRNDRVQKFDSDGRFIHRFGSSGGGTGQFDRPAGIAVDGDGDVYVADLGNHRVQMYDRGRSLPPDLHRGRDAFQVGPAVHSGECEGPATQVRVQSRAGEVPPRANVADRRHPGPHGHNRRRPLPRAGLPEGCRPAGGDTDSSAPQGADAGHRLGSAGLSTHTPAYHP